jgi:hypothetical protein
MVLAAVDATVAPALATRCVLNWRTILRYKLFQNYYWNYWNVSICWSWFEWDFIYVLYCFISWQIVEGRIFTFMRMNFWYFWSAPTMLLCSIEIRNRFWKLTQLKWIEWSWNSFKAVFFLVYSIHLTSFNIFCGALHVDKYSNTVPSLVIFSKIDNIVFLKLIRIYHNDVFISLYS